MLHLDWVFLTAGITSESHLDVAPKGNSAVHSKRRIVVHEVRFHSDRAEIVSLGAYRFEGERFYLANETIVVMMEEDRVVTLWNFQHNRSRSWSLIFQMNGITYDPTQARSYAPPA